MADTGAPRRDDSGFSLIELLVGMAIFIVFLTIMVSALVGLSRTAVKVQLVAQSSTEVLNLFRQFDRQVPYADAINYPGAGPSGARYVEYRTPGSSLASGVTTCTQWRYVASTGTIDVRTWPEGGTPSAWSTKLTRVIDDGGSAYPFAMTPAGSAASTQQQLTLTVHTGTTVNDGTAISTSYVARNSSTQSPSNSSTQQAGVSDTPVCLPSGRRP